MVKTLVRSSLREIRQSLGRYLAILAIVGLGVGFFAGLRMCQPDMMATGADYLRDQQMHDFRLLSTLGFTEEDVAAFAGVEGVSAARGAVYTDFLMAEGEREIVLRAHSLMEDIDLPKLEAGRMPQAPDECLADAHRFTEADLGRTLAVSPNNDEDTLDLLAYDGYTIVGLVRSPSYLNYDRGTTSIGTGSVAAFLYIPEEGFDFEAYYEVYLTLDAPGEAWSAAYEDRIDGMKPGLEDLTEERADLRYSDIYGDAMEEIRDAEEEIADGWAEYRQERADAERELQDAHRDLLDGEAEYADGLADYEQGKLDYADGLREYQDGVRELEDARLEVEDGRAELEDAKQELQDAEAELQDAKAQLDEGNASYDQLNGLYQSAVQLAQATGTGTPAQLVAALQSGRSPQLNASVDGAMKAQGSSLEEFLGGWTAAESSIGQPLSEEYLAGLRASLDQGQADYERGLADYEEGLAAYEEGAADFEAGLLEYEDGVRKMEDAKRELRDAKRELDDAPGELQDARQELDDGWAEYEDGLKEAEEEFADAEAELSDAEAEVADAYAELSDLREASTYVLIREENTGYSCFDSDISIVAAISLVFPVFFFLVAALVCMTTMTRMVDEQRTQIGVLKALGYSNGQIMGKYLFYSGSAALVGCVIGYALGARWLPWIIWDIYGMLYGFAPLQFVFNLPLVAVSFAGALLCSMGATWLSCRAELRRPAAELIRPKAPKAGRRVLLEYVTPVWRRLSFLHKVSLRNVFRYHSRLIMMVLGIGGCTALLVTGFGIRDSIKSVVDDQFAEITLYDYSVTFRDPQTRDSVDAYLAERGWEAGDGLLVHSGSVDILAQGGSKSVYNVVSAASDLGDYISLHSGETPIPYPGPGEVVLNVGLAESLGIRVGDTVRLRDDDLGELTVTVSAICDNYVFNYVYVAPETYRQQLDLEPDYATLYLMAHEGADPYGEGAHLAEVEDVSNVSVNAATREQTEKMLSRLDYVVIVVVVCAAALAFIVLYSLTNINITERVREIATIKVLGFHRNEVAAYVFREINILAFLGSLVGLLMGVGLHAFVMAQVQIDAMYFPCRIAPVSYLISFVTTMLFTLVIGLGMRPRLGRVHMAESLKSIE